MMQGPGIEAPSQVSEGATFEISVGGAAEKVTVSVGSTGESFEVPVKNGRATVTVPVTAKGGDLMTITFTGPKARKGVTVEITAQD